MSMKAKFWLPVVVLIGLLFSVASLVQAEPKRIEATGTYALAQDTNEGIAAAEDLARTAAQRTAAEQAGVYVESYSKTHNFVLQKDEVTALAAHIMRIEKEIVSKKILDDGDIEFTVTIQATINPEASDLAIVMRDRAKLHEIVQTYQERQSRYAEEKKKNDELKRKMIENQFVGRQDAQKIQHRKRDKQTLFQVNQALRRGAVLSRQGNWKGAIKSFQEAVSLDPQEADAYWRLGQAYGEIGQYKKSEEVLRKGLKIRPKDVRMHALLGTTYSFMNEHGKAIAELRRAIKMAPGKEGENGLNNGADMQTISISYTMLGDAYRRMGDFQNALESYMHALNFDSLNDGDLYFKIGEAYANLGEDVRAIEAMEHGIAVYPNRLEPAPAGFFNLGVCYLRTGKSEKALDYITRAINLFRRKSELYDAYYHRALAYAALGKKNEAFQDLDTAASLAENKDRLQAVNNLRQTILKMETQPT